LAGPAQGFRAGRFLRSSLAQVRQEEERAFGRHLLEALPLARGQLLSRFLFHGSSAGSKPAAVGAA
jgi:hypothetical protein